MRGVRHHGQLSVVRQWNCLYSLLDWLFRQYFRRVRTVQLRYCSVRCLPQLHRLLRLQLYGVILRQCHWGVFSMRQQSQYVHQHDLALEIVS